MDFLPSIDSAAAIGQRLLTISAVLISLAIFGCIGQFIYNVYFHPLRNYPGPKFWAGSRIPAFWYALRGQSRVKIPDLHAKYGPVVRIGPTEVSYISDTAWKTIYGHRNNEMSKLTDGRGGFIPPPNGIHNIITAGRADHSRLRRNVAHAFSEKALRDQESYIQDYVSQLIAALNKVAATGVPQDMSRWYNFTTFDIIGDLAFGEPFGCLRDSKFHSWVNTIFEGVLIIPWLQLTRYYKLLGYFENYIVPKHMREGRLRNYKISGEKMERRVARTEDRKDFTSFMLRHSDEKGLSNKELTNMAVVLIIAGSETTATLLTGVTFHLLKNPRVYKLLTQEIRSKFKYEEDITMAAANELKYMLAVLDEGLRMHPPVPNALPRVVPTGGEMIDGRWVPEGTGVGVHQYSAFTSEVNFHRAKEFIPERWLDEASGGWPEFAGDNKASFQPFSAGPRNCVGKNLAYAEMRLILARVLFNFDFVLEESCRNWEDESLTPFLWERKPMMARLVPLSQQE